MMTTQEAAPGKRFSKFDRILGAAVVGCVVVWAGPPVYHHFKHHQAQTQASPEAVPGTAVPSSAASKHGYTTTPVTKPVVKKPVVKPYALPPNTSTLHTYAQYEYIQDHVDAQVIPQSAAQRPITGNTIADTLIINAVAHAGYQQRAAVNPNKLIPYQGSLIQPQVEKPLNTMLSEAAKLHIPIKFAGSYVDSGTQDQRFLGALNPNKHSLLSDGFSQELIDIKNNGVNQEGQDVFKTAVPSQFSLAPSGLAIRFTCGESPMTGADPCSTAIKHDYYALAQENGFIPYVTPHNGLIADEFVYARAS